MRRPLIASGPSARGLMLIACLLLVGFATAKPASAGPIAERFKQWSSQRQSQVRVEKPFSGQSGNVEINGQSMAQKLRQRLTSKGKDNATSHQLKTEKKYHDDDGKLLR